jgi:epsilon-lactone hydrolase
MANEDLPPLQVPARAVPVPAHLSPHAQAVLSIGAIPADAWPALDDHEAWIRSREERNETTLAAVAPQANAIAADVKEITVGETTIYVITPADAPPSDRVLLDVHGGGLVMGNGACCRAMGLMASRRAGVETWAVDYRMPPEHPYPAAVDDCLAVYRTLLETHNPEDIAIGGASAGGNIAAATILRARDEDLPLPAAAVLLTPELDLTESGDSFRTNLGVDTVLTQSLMPANLLYANGHDLTDPYVSPLFGDFTKGFPPTLLMAGTRDLFLSNAARMHRALRVAGVPAELHILEAAPHGGFFGAPEDEEIDREVHRFVDTHSH